MASLKTMLQLQDNMSAPILKITNVMHTMVEGMSDMQAATDTAFNSAAIDSMRNDLNEANVALNQIADTANEATRNQDQFTNSIDRSVSSANNLNNVFSNFLQSVGAMTLLNKAVNMVTSSVDSAISRFDTLNNFPKRMEQMGYSAEEASASINRLSDGLQGLPTALNDMTGVVSKFEVITKSLDYSTESALSLNNALLASGASTAVATNATEQYLQMLGNATVDAQSWRSMVNGATYAMNELAESFGYTSIVVGGDFYTALQNNEVTMAELNSRMIELNNTTGGFAEVAKTATGGIGTAWENMQTAITRGVTTVVNALDSVFANTSFGSLEGAITSLGATFNSVLNGIAVGVSVIGNLAVEVGSFVADGLNAIAPIVYGIAGGLAVYATYLAITKAQALLAAAAQAILNSNMLASPVFWMAAALATVIFVVYKFAQSIAETSDVATSAFSVITGGINVVGAFFKNLVLTVANVGLGIWEVLKAVTSNIVTAFSNTIKNVQAFFYNLLSTVLTVVDKIASALNQLPFIEFDYSGIGNAAAEYAQKAADLLESKSEYKDIGAAFNEGYNTYDVFVDGWKEEAFAAGAAWGDSISDKVSNLFNGVTDLNTGYDPSDYIYDPDTGLDDTLTAGTSEADYLSNIDDNTADIATAVLDTSDAQLKYLKEIAERLAISDSTPVVVNMNVENNVSSGSSSDIDGILSSITDGLSEAMAISSEGVHV